jgi:hypothetical protein
VKKIILLLALVACTKDEKPTTKAPEPAASTAAPASAAKVTELGPGKQRVDGQNFSLDLASTGCKAGADCTLTIKLTAAADYHVNKEYPYKFTATSAPNVTFLGKKEPPTFTKEAGDFVEEGEKSGTMTVRFKPAAAGEAKVAGTYKMSVCSADQCQIEAQPIALNVPVN